MRTASKQRSIWWLPTWSCETFVRMIMDAVATSNTKRKPAWHTFMGLAGKAHDTASPGSFCTQSDAGYPSDDLMFKNDVTYSYIS
eukprot:2942221-Amphidinium_carterae.1